MVLEKAAIPESCNKIAAPVQISSVRAIPWGHHQGNQKQQQSQGQQREGEKQGKAHLPDQFHQDRLAGSQQDGVEGDGVPLGRGEVLHPQCHRARRIRQRDQRRLGGRVEKKIGIAPRLAVLKNQHAVGVDPQGGIHHFEIEIVPLLRSDLRRQCEGSPRGQRPHRQRKGDRFAVQPPLRHPLRDGSGLTFRLKQPCRNKERRDQRRDTHRR